MKKIIHILLITIFCFQMNGKAENLSEENNFLDQFTKTIAGVYQSDFNELTLHINGNHVTGTYKYKGGKVDGILTGSKLVGTWWQTNGKGKMEFNFNSDFSAFSGKWGYNDSAPTSKWNGTKISEIRTEEVPLTSLENNSGANNTTPPYEGILGVFNTDFNKMIIYVNGKDITGEYKHNGGKIAGRFNKDHILTGTWSQSNGKGKMEFVFNSDYSAFKGKWGYNDESPTKKWDGTKIAENYDGLIPLFGVSKRGNSKEIQNNTIIEGTYSSDFNELTLHINGNRVSGTYKYKDGRVEGTLNGHTLTGTWSQSNGKGRLQFVFSDDFSSFQGKWGYNDSAPSSKWNGTKL